MPAPFRGDLWSHRSYEGRYIWRWECGRYRHIRVRPQRRRTGNSRVFREQERTMDPDTEFRRRGTCLTCYTRSFRINDHGVCLKCFTHAADLRAASMFPLPFEAAPRQGWDIGVCPVRPHQDVPR
jgi:hypothetical protein